MNEKTVTTDTPQPACASRAVRPGTVAAALAVLGLASVCIFRGLADEPHFADESAMIAQSYYYTLLKRGQWNHCDWLHYAAYDHPPLPKYLFGLSLDMARLPVPQSLDWWMRWSGFEPAPSGGWMPSRAGNDFSPPSDPRVLFWARVPSAVFGVGGVLAIFFVGLQVRGRLMGIAAALLLVANPLYLTHARRAMSDSFAECLVIGSVAIALWGWKQLWHAEFRWRRWLVFVLAESVLCGLAALAKLNGGVAAVIVLSTLGLGWLLATWKWLRHRSRDRGERPSGWNLAIGPVAAVTIAAGSFLVFIGLNPFLTARPPAGAELWPGSGELVQKGVVSRAKYLVDFRSQWSHDARENSGFQKDWLRTPAERGRMTIWEAFGRYSVLGPRNIRTVEPRPETERFSEYRRANSLVWFPLFLWGVGCAMYHGWLKCRAGQPPQAWVLLVYAAAALAIVLLLIPLNWDRYFLPIQPTASVLVPYGVACTLRWVGSRLMLKPPVEVGPLSR